MATVNGTLKYKQDDGDIVAINPIGVDNTARKNVLIAVNTIGTWQLDNPTSSIADVIGQWDMTHDVSGGETITTVLDRTSAHLSNEITDREKADTALDTRVTKLENAGGTQTVYHVPVVGIITGFFNHGFIVSIPMPENLITALVNGKSFSSAVLKRLGGEEGNAILHGYKRNGTPFTLQIPVNTEVGVSRSPTLLEYSYVNTDMDFNADDYGGVTVYASSSIVANGGILVEVTLN